MKNTGLAACVVAALAPGLSLAQAVPTAPETPAGAAPAASEPAPTATPADDRRPLVAWRAHPHATVFMARKPGTRLLMGFGAIGGLMSAAAQMDDGAHIRDQHHLTDPADAVAKGVAATFAEMHDGRVAGDAAESPGRKPAAPPQRTDGAAWEVDVATLEWGLTSRGMTSGYDVMLMEHIAIYDVATGAVVAEGACHHGGETRRGGASTDYATLMGDGPDGIHARFERVEQECVDTFKREHLEPQPAKAPSA